MAAATIEQKPVVLDGLRRSISGGLPVSLISNAAVIERARVFVLIE
jgi:hypothetical protein